MREKVLAFSFAIFVLSSTLLASEAKTPARTLTAAEIANRNVAARGGLQAWRAVQSLLESGRLTAGGDQRNSAAITQSPGVQPPVDLKSMSANSRLKEEAQLPFVLKMERPRKTRYEIEFDGKTAVQVYDGTRGWKLRPFLNRPQAEPFTSAELKDAALQPDLDGPLINYAEKGVRIELEGQEQVDGRDTYKLKLTMADNHVTHVWIDTETFLEDKIEGQPRRLDGREHTVEVYFRDYRDIGGLKFPFLLETHVLPLAERGTKYVAMRYSPEKILVDKIIINPKLSDADFQKPTIQSAQAHP